MTRTTLIRLGATVALAGVTLAACSGTSTTTASPAATVAPTEAPSTAESAAPSTEASASPAASTAESFAPSGSPEARTVQVQSGDDRFMNLPVDPTPGTVLTFRNVGTQAHGMWVLLRNADATKDQTFDKLATMKLTDLFKFVTVVGVLTADPGQESSGQIVLDQPGDYAVVDLLPVGTTTAPPSPDPSAIPVGIPNITKGLAGTFSVVAPSAS